MLLAPDRGEAAPLPLSGARSMKNGGVVQTAESFKGKKSTESRGDKGMMPLPDFSPDNPAYDGRGQRRPPNAGSPPSNLIEGGRDGRVGRRRR